MKVQVVVSMSGQFTLEVEGVDKVTADDIIAKATEMWGVSPDELFQPFVVAASMSSGGHRLLEGTDNVLEGLGDGSMLRVAMPLRAKD